MTRHPAFTLVELLVLIGIIVILGMCVFDAILHAPFAFIFGWVRFLIRVVPEVHVDASWILGCVVFGGGTFLGTHALCRWFHRHLVPSGTAWRWSNSLRVFVLIIALFLGGIAMIGVTHQSAWLLTSGDPVFFNQSSRVRSRINLKQQALATMVHHDERKSLPRAAIFDAAGNPLHGWPAQLLPYLDNEPLHARIDFNLPWSAPDNQVVFRSHVQAFVHPSISTRMNSNLLEPIHYAGNAYVLAPGGPKTLQEVTDGISNTLLIGQVNSNIVPWGSPIHWRDPILGLNRSPKGFGAAKHEEGVDFTMLDGSVRFLSNHINPAVLKALATPNGGEPKEQHQD